ncbi:MAG: peptidoglycan editing factor PgeF [Oscillospiraceae bacterium]|jgi:YfiH family protein|nr:peptidoglycan editing factor PgeF [Oscillospiraceae bacterium]
MGFNYMFCGKHDTPEREFYRAKQVRGDRVVTADELPCEADAVVTNRVGVAVAVGAADCVPLLMYSASARCVAAVHSGWQGTSLNIAAIAVRKLTELYGASPRDIEAYIGPAICGECYEVGGEVIAVVKSTLADKSAGDVAELPANIDLRAVVAQQLREAGVERITAHSDCVRCSSDRYWSRRAELELGGGYELNISYIELT